MTIRIQVVGGLGNQLFIWAGAHKLQSDYKTRVKLIHILDKNTRRDRNLEIDRLSRLCEHDISIRTWRTLGVLFRVLDKFHLERKEIFSNVLKRIGVYSFDNPVSELIFDKGRPRLIRCYFQRTEIVEASWRTLFEEFSQALKLVELKDFNIDENYTAVHLRRGDSLNLVNSFGVLSSGYFQSNTPDFPPVYICTDDMHLPKDIYIKLNPKEVFNPDVSDTWQTLKIFYESELFIGANSTLSWWASFLRSKNDSNVSVLPIPWTRRELGFDNALYIRGVDYKNAEFLTGE